jgi:mannose-1-phosphate guanylyltransferase
MKSKIVPVIIAGGNGTPLRWADLGSWDSVWKTGRKNGDANVVTERVAVWNALLADSVARYSSCGSRVR